MSKPTLEAINNKKSVRSLYGESSVSYKIAKAEVKKLVKKDKINNLNNDLDQFLTLPSDKQFYCCQKIKN